MSDLIERSMNGLTIHLDGEYDCLTTQIGLVENVDRIVICEGDTRFENGELHLNFNKDPSKFCIDEQSYGGTSVKAITFADLSSGLERM